MRSGKPCPCMNEASSEWPFAAATQMSEHHNLSLLARSRFGQLEHAVTQMTLFAGGSFPSPERRPAFPCRTPPSGRAAPLSSPPCLENGGRDLYGGSAGRSF